MEKVSERIGRIKERYPSISKHYEINLELDNEQKKVVNIVWDKKVSREVRSALVGCYVIETDRKDLEGREIWELYTTLTCIESAFKALKTNLGIRPVRHQLSQRCSAHLFISVLAYHLLNSIEYQLKEKEDHRCWTTIKAELSTHHRTTVILTGEDDEIYHIRVSGTPESTHRNIYELLDIRDPLKRVKRAMGKRL